MKKITFLTFLLISSLGFSQVNPVDFEAGGNGADWGFGTFANGDPAIDPLAIVDNPNPSGINTSSKVVRVITKVGGEVYAGFFTSNPADVGTFTLDASNSTVKLKVYKPVISDIGFKLEGDNGNLPNDMGELKVSNTVINQWEEITFDFSAYIGTPQAVGLRTITFIPDFAARTQDNTIYLDDITFSAILGVDEFQKANFKVYPNPATANWTIKSQSSLISSLELMDIQGKRVFSSQPDSLETTIDASQFSQGLYIARISSAKGVETVKLVKQ